MTSPGARPPNIHLAQRQPLGIHPVPLLTGLGSASLLLGIVLLGVGAVIPGVLILALALVFLTLLRFAVRREPEAPLARSIGRVTDRCRSTLELLVVTLRTTWRAAMNLLRIRGRQWRLRGELQGHLKPLGEATYHDDHARAQALKRHAHELEQQLRASEHEASAVIGAARQEIRRQRAASQPTEVISQPGEE
jgi:hypothetical protein